MPNKDDFVKEIMKMQQVAKDEGAAYIDIVSGDVHRKLGGYPNRNHAMPTCCDAMYELMKPGDEIIEAPPKGKGATVKVRYYL